MGKKLLKTIEGCGWVYQDQYVKGADKGLRAMRYLKL